MTPDFPYVELPGSFRGFFRKASLWEGIDHILSVSGTRFNEEYRRFYYRDIQALILETRPQAGSFGWWAVLLSLLITASIIWANSGRYWWIAVVAVVVALLIRTYICMGRSCRCSIQTAVSREILPSLIRLSASEAAIARIQLRITAEQGELPEEMPVQEEDVTAAVIPPDPEQPSAVEVLDKAALRERRQAGANAVNWAVVAFFMLLLNAGLAFWLASTVNINESHELALVGYALVAVELIAVILSLQKLERLRGVGDLRLFLLALIVLDASVFVIDRGISFAIRAQEAVSQFITMRLYRNISGGVELTFAAIGLILIFTKWEVYRRGDEFRS